MSLSVLMIAPTSFFADYGAHVRPLEEIRALQRLGHQVTVCTYHNGHDVPGITIERSIDIPWRKRVVVGTTRHKLYLDAALFAIVLREMHRLKPDIIHAHLHEGALIGQLARATHHAPLLFDYQGSLTGEMTDHGFLGASSLLRAPLARFERTINHAADMIVTSTHHAANRLRATGGMNEARVACIPDAVDTQRFRPDALATNERALLRAQLGIRPTDKVVVYLGLLAPYQGTDMLLEAAADVLRRVPDAFFLIMGFPGNERYRVLAERLGIAHRVSLPGQIPYLDAHRYLALGDIAVAPKLSETEGNQKIFNYLATGLPVVAFDTPASREILGEHATLATRGDAGSLATQITALLSDPATARRTGLAGRAVALQNFSWERRGTDLLRAYARILPPEKLPLVGLPQAAPTPAPVFADGGSD
ncbi:MAG: glycosyltransferase family 4 protein [Thermomicrobia bacterium]|nr:glycosyltransferase family 4 protein [Thermomicrobia bacterium]